MRRRDETIERDEREKRRDSCSVAGQRANHSPSTRLRAPARALSRSRRLTFLVCSFAKEGDARDGICPPRPRFRPRMTTDKFSRLLSFWPGALSSVAHARFRLYARHSSHPSATTPCRPSPFSLSRHSPFSRHFVFETARGRIFAGFKYSSFWVAEEPTQNCRNIIAENCITLFN